MRRQAEAGRSAAELSLVNMKGKSEVDLAADRAIARLTAAGFAPPVAGAACGCAPVVPPGGAVMTAANAAASATHTAAVCAGAQASGGWFVPRAAAPAEPAVTEPSSIEPQEAPRRRRTLSGLISKLLVKSVIR